MSGSVTFAPARPCTAARSAPDAAPPCADCPAVRLARDVMTPDPHTVACSDPLLEVAGVMRGLLVAFLPVCDEHGDLQGVIALQDLHRVLRPGHPTKATASSLAQNPPMTIGLNDPVDQVWDLMAEQRMWLLPVLDGRRLVGVVHFRTARSNEHFGASTRSAPHAGPTSMRDPLPSPPGRVRDGRQPSDSCDHRHEPDAGELHSGGRRRCEAR
jgi:CBS domain-containing protein